MNVKTNQTAKIIRLLRSGRYVTNADLNAICFRYSARIHELRNEGWDIQKHYVKPGLYRYWVNEEPESGESY